MKIKNRKKSNIYTVNISEDVDKAVATFREETLSNDERIVSVSVIEGSLVIATEVESSGPWLILDHKEDL